MAKRKTLDQWKEELVGKQFGRLTVIDVIPYTDKKGNKKGCSVLCQCICGNQKIVPVNSLIKGLTQSCGCYKKEVEKDLGVKLTQWKKEHPKESNQKKKNKPILALYKESCTNSNKQNPCIKESNKQPVDLLEHNKEKYIGKRFGRLLITDLFFRDAIHSYSFLIAVCACDCGNTKNILLRSVLAGNTQSCGCLSKEQAKINVVSAHQWFKDNPEKAKDIWDKNKDRFIQYREDHPEAFKQHLIESLYQSNLNRSSKEELDLNEYLLSLGYNPDRQFLLDGHYFDFKINNFLIEYNGSVYHCSVYQNIEFPTSTPPRVSFKNKNFHSSLKELANKHNYHLIQIWDFDWLHRKEFIQRLLKEQLNNTADYKSYLEDNNLLNNDYGFSLKGELVEPKPIWVSTGYRSIVDSTYPKGRVLVYNSGYIKVKE